MPPKKLISTTAENKTINATTPLKDHLDFLQESTRVTEVKRGRPPKNTDAAKTNLKTPKPNEAMKMFKNPLFPQNISNTNEEKDVVAAADKAKQSFGWSTNPWGMDA